MPGEPEREKVGAVVAETIMTILPVVTAEQITQDKHLKDLGADSVDRVEIILALIDRFGLDEPMGSFSAIPNLGTLIDFLVERTRR